ncbi:unnamed protein product [Menidia menidia]|uniref:(Atlantic silverside) hypothetical protein n=1 Tax=Menidia menidia TaxID=238744 RepID=A0A8S4BMD5_9TELE|nr:unnamed protein product [Menidia menidia]
MSPPLLAWTLVTAFVWTLGSSQFIQGDPVHVLYPAISSSESLDCECVNISCDTVFWFHTDPARGKLRFLAKCNRADRVQYGDVNQTRYKFSRRGSSSFVLRIIGITEADAGIYSCILRDSRNDAEKFRPGFLLRPGETPPPPRTTPKPKPKPPCRCSRNPKRSGCSSLLLWPLAGLAAGLAVVILGVLYYFSRLPKKCQHHFVKKRLMT